MTFAEKNARTVSFFPFCGKHGAEVPVCALSLAAAGALRPGEDDGRRKDFFSSLGISDGRVESLSQIHSQKVCVFPGPDFLSAGRPPGDGILTDCVSAVPCVTVADCMPVWLFDSGTGCFGVLHSGWKGTGILASAVRAAEARWGSKASDFSVIFGPHIRNCCYTVDRERAQYFSRTFSASCVTLDETLLRAGSPWPYRLSLAEANLSICRSLGIPAEQISDTGICTCCSSLYGSSRRESAGKPSSPAASGSRTPFTSMAAFIYYS